MGGIIWWIIVGLIAGWLTGKIMGGGGKGALMDIIIGLIGALIGVSVAWISGRRRRRELQRHRRRIEALERELSATQSQLKNQAESVRPRLPASS